MMPTSATGTSRTGRRGFTLVELLVVVTIIGVAASAVVLSLPEPVPPVLSEAERFAARLTLAREEALLTNRSVAVRLDPDGYRFEAFDGDGWQSLDGPLMARSWPDRIEVHAPARLMFDATGLSDPADIRLSRDGQSQVLRLDGAGEVSLVR